MISHEHKAIFIHIPKCAGSSIESILGGKRDHFSLRMLQRPVPFKLALTNVENAKDLLRTAKVKLDKSRSSRLLITEDQYSSYFKFSVVRNPWARCFSWYKNVLRDENHRSRFNVAVDASFGSFLESFIGRGVLKPQTYWLRDYDGNIGVDFIGRFEHLEDDFEFIKNRLSLGDVLLPHHKNGMNEPYVDAYNKHLRDLVNHYYAEEISMFGYKFD